jgi:pimeloyl-ACP methyl ester carboxylesterase
MPGVKISWHESSVALPSGGIRVWERGEGPALIWSHGLLHPIALEELTPLRELLDGMQGRRVVRYDARGHGGSAAGRNDAANHWDQLGADLLELAGALEIERFVAAGASMGVAASLRAALLAPERIAALLLLIPPTAWESRPAQVGLYRAMAHILDEKGTVAVAKAVEEALRAQPVAPGFEPAQEALYEALRGWDPPALGHVLRGAADSDLPDRERLTEIDAPTLIVAVRDDPGHPLSTAEALAERMPFAQLRVVASLAEVDQIQATTTRFLEEIAVTGC